MKKILIFIIPLIVVILLNSCGTVEPTANSNISVLEGLQLLDTVNTKFRELASKPGSGPINSLQGTKNWLSGLPNVSGATILDDYYMIIQLKSGISLTFNLNQVDAEGYSIYRGGSGDGANTVSLEKYDQLQKRTVPNKKVLIYAAAYSDFYKPGELEKILSHFGKSKEKFDVTVLKNTDCKPEIIQTFGNYGLVIIDTHGEPDGFMTGSIISFDSKPKTEDEVINVIKTTFGSDDNYKRILNKELRMGTTTTWEVDTTKPNWLGDFRGGQLYASSKLIMNLPRLSNTIVFGNCCYSGYGIKPPEHYSDVPIRTAFLKAEPISYYGYTLNSDRATVVSNEFSKPMEDSLIKSLVIDLDTTKQANLSYSNLEFYDTYLFKNDLEHGKKNPEKLWFRHFNHDDYWFGGCVEEFTDPRDGEKYKVVCIDGMTWMAENLRFSTGACYPGIDCRKYGKLYDWFTVMKGSSHSNKIPSGVTGICPPGWHVPSMAEWKKLIESKEVGGKSVGGGTLKATTDWTSPNKGATDKLGFKALPGGLYHPDEKQFFFHGLEGHWWTSSAGHNAGNYYFTFITNTQTKVNFEFDNKPGFMYSCRCVKD